ncbi:MAG: flagellar motor protein MotA [Rhodospirillaceae bacterium]|jgi:biopolymer transport protein ExbB/TolQ|nr:flagellar motor protein MotA [Rhodospirillaceae bacterium]MBT3883431.1 flagellar motor protein MotA [Rhodospirillaceae bacterium]MBT4115342.1 flagellar motor protein MotA [Rhodospirillaceae bacterium]MBT4670675.1 flagellar motor protein MotA [Rhodospirillaceae bacterium]MBT4718722.1 flagellar motor protein MotA [Rhodospirillaceae bacterium]
MNSPQRYVIRMALFLAAVVILCVILIEPLQRAFAANFGLNGLIVGVLILGIAYNFRQVLRLNPEVHWIESFRRAGPAISETRQPKLLAPMATMLGERDDTLSLSTLSMRSLLDGIASRLDEARELSRYTIGLLIFLGLLGTFWGLLQTIGSISDVIGGLTVGGGDVTTVFNSLKSGLVVPLSGMGTAFSSSLFGLAGSLVLGFLDLQAGQASNRFYNDLEEWLSSLTRLSSGGLSAEGDQSVPAYVQALLEQTAENLDKLQRTLARGEESNSQANTASMQLVEVLGSLGDQMRGQQTILTGLADNQVQLRATLEKLADPGRTGSAGLDEATQAHIRNLDIYVARLLEEISAGRDDLIGQVRSEIKLLARTIAAGAASSRAAPPAPKK